MCFLHTSYLINPSTMTMTFLDGKIRPTNSGEKIYLKSSLVGFRD